jgi:hypothetical protein
MAPRYLDAAGPVAVAGCLAAGFERYAREQLVEAATA